MLAAWELKISSPGPGCVSLTLHFNWYGKRYLNHNVVSACNVLRLSYWDYGAQNNTAVFGNDWMVRV